MKAQYTTLNTKGQIIIPAEIRAQMKLSVGTKLSIQRDGPGPHSAADHL